MRLKITFKVLNKGAKLSFSYQPFISAWLYNTLANADPLLADFLHQKGYCLNNRKFKFFTFSKLYLHNFKTDGEFMQIFDEDVSLIVSGFVPMMLHKLFMGLFEQQKQLFWGNALHKLHLEIAQIETLEPIRFTDTMRFTCISPMAVGKKDDTDLTRNNTQYLSPNDGEFARFFTLNLLEKYNAALEHGLLDPLPYPPQIVFKPLTQQPKQKLITLKKADTEGKDSRARAYLFDFELKAPADILRLGYLGGFGKHNAMGLGMVKLFSDKTLKQH
ncbi:CRISPR-associated endoribonuclease Cas6 [Sphingobacteriales bacterium UPWRP_1]|nr:CRISPR-associated endoribonuclease Cas6 [Sphingobacteriales bacterium UPWRP_1]